MMRRILLSLLWIAVVLLIVQVAYFVFFGARPLKYNEGTPLTAERVVFDIKNISCLYNDGDGVIWIGTDGHGIYRYETTGLDAVAIATPEELEHAAIRSLTVDGYGRLWAGTSRNGLFVRNDGQWQHYAIGERIPAIGVSPVDGIVALATDRGVIGYHTEKETWLDMDFGIVQPTALAFNANGDLFVGTACHGLIRLDRDDADHFQVGKHITAPRRFGPGSAPEISPVPLAPCGEGLPSNQINAMLIDSGGTVWAGTSAGLAWSRDNGETWIFLRGRDYGDKMRGLFAGTPHGWKELPRTRFGELAPEDHITLLVEDESGMFWVGTSSLGCIALKPSSFHCNVLPKNGDPESQRKFLDEIATESSRFHGTKVDSIVAMTPLAGSGILFASSTGSLEKMECPGRPQGVTTLSKPARTASQQVFPVPYPAKTTEKPDRKTDDPGVVFLGENRTTLNPWSGKYGKAYTLIGGGEMPHDRLVAFDETACQVRLFVGNVGNRTRPLERVTLSSIHHHHHDGDDHDHDHSTEQALTGWSSTGDTVPRTADGQHLWCEVKLNQPGRHELSLYFADPEPNRSQTKETRDYLIEVFSNMPASKIRIPKNDWQEPGRQADGWAAQTEPLARSRVVDFQDGIYERFALTGPGTWLVKIDKNYGRKVDLCAVLIDKTDADDTTDTMELPVMSEDQSSDEIP